MEKYEVKHRVLDTRHALKLINESIMKNKVALSYFKSEGRVMAQLHHPGIVLLMSLVRPTEDIGSEWNS